MEMIVMVEDFSCYYSSIPSNDVFNEERQNTFKRWRAERASLELHRRSVVQSRVPL